MSGNNPITQARILATPDGNDSGGFARLIQSVMAEEILDVSKTQHYQHRVGTNRKPIQCSAIVGNKRCDIGNGLLP